MARPNQITPPGDWKTWFIMAGRGFGKTRTGAEDSWWYGIQNPGHRTTVIAPTSSDLRDVCFGGESGLISVIPESLIRDYKSSFHEITLVNGSIIKGFSAEEPRRLRGPQHHRVWAEELAAWEKPQATWDMMQFGLRLGEDPQVIVTSTPKPIPLIKDLIKRKNTLITRGSTYDNRANLAKSFFDEVTQYEGTSLGRQEIHGEIINLEELGIFKRSWFKKWPAGKTLPKFEFVVQSYDTAFTQKTTGDPTAFTAWGVFMHESKWNVILLDCWEDRLQFHELRSRSMQEYKVTYGEQDKRADVVLIEDKGSGISLRQELQHAGIPVIAYNPGRADKVQRAHSVSHVFHNNLVWVPESAKRPGEFVSWADPLLSQLCAFNGANSKEDHDDYVDSTTQAIKLILDQQWLEIDRIEEVVYTERKSKFINPYSV